MDDDMPSAGSVDIAQAPHQRTQQQWEQAQDVGGIAYVDDGPRAKGPGMPVLFLHGLGGAARQFIGPVRHVGARRRVIAWDMPGYGGSAPLPLMTMDALAAALAGFIGALGLERPVLVGHSVGAMVAQRLVAEAPQMAGALVLAQTRDGRDPAWAAQFIAERIGPLDAGRTMAELAPGIVAAMVGDGRDAPGLALAVDCLAHTPESTYRDTVLAMAGFDGLDALPRIGVPTLVLAGTRDPYAPVAGMVRLAERIPGARYVALEGAGHLAHLEQPGPFAAALDAFLDGL